MRASSKFLLLTLALASPMHATVIEAVSFADDAALGQAWKPQGESQAPALSMGGDQERAIRFPAAFSTVADWRVYWDRDLKADLSGDEQVLVTVRSPDPGSVSQGILFFRSGPGWYRMTPFSVGKEWTVTVLSKGQAVAEGQPAGWDHVEGVRLSFLPGEKKDTYVELAGISGRSGWTLEHLGAVGGYEDLSASAAAFRAAAQGRPMEADVEARLKEAWRFQALAAVEKDPEQRQTEILQGREQVAQAYALVQAPKPGEFRAAWIHNGDGPRGSGGARVRRWKEALPELKAQGYNTVAPNMLWSGVAFYPSKIVPNAEGVAKEGDYLQEIIDAAKPLGMKVHVWKVMWQFAEGWLAPAGVSEPFRKEGRLQVDAQGKELPWLCPCDERNRKYELDAIRELATSYKIDGIHLDYIRWDGDKGSYTPMCRGRFEKWSKKKVEHWPADVLAGGPRLGEWQDFKRDVITSFVRETRRMLKELRPKMELSAAVFSDAGIARNGVFQDWPLWVKEGLLDWVSTMTYNEDAAGFRSAVEKQEVLFAGSSTRLYPGLQMTYDHGRVLALDAAVDEIKAVRELGLGGFTIFEWRDQIQDTTGPYLRAGLLSDGPYALTLRPLPDYAKAPEAVKGQALDLKAGKDGLVVLDDFEDGNLTNEAYGAWNLDFDSNGLGTRVDKQPLQALPGGPAGSKFYLGYEGHYGKNQAPWPYATMDTVLNPDRAPVDLSHFKGLGFFAKGDGKTYNVVLHQAVVKDYGYYRANFKAGPDWTWVELNWKDFAQPGWAQPVAHRFVDVDQLQFGPSGTLSDEDFRLGIDKVVLR